MSKRARRLAACAVVLVTAVLAWAAVPPDVRSEPEVTVIELLGSSPVNASLTLANHGTTATMIDGLGATGDCTGVTVLQPALPFRLGSQSEGSGASSEALQVRCSPTTFGIRRCQFDATENLAQRASFTVLCVAGGSGALNGALTANQAVLDFGPVQIGSTPVRRTVRITNQASMSISMLDAQIDEQAPNHTFRIANCIGDSPGCRLAAVVPPTAFLDLDIDCSPQALGLTQQHLYVVATTGPRVMGSITLTCTGTGSPSGGITVTPTSLALAQQVDSPVTGNLTVANTSPTTAYTVQSTSIFGAASTEWAVQSSCALPCTVSPGTSLTLTATFTPNAHGAQDATLSINTDDPGATTIDRELGGTGYGATLELVTDLGVPTTFHVTTRPIGVTGDRAFVIRNGGNVELTNLTYTITQSGNQFAMVASPDEIGAGLSDEVRVACTPTAAVDFTATLEIRSTSPSAYAGSPITIALRCTGTSGSLYNEPSAVDFGEIRIAPGQLVTQTVTLRTGMSALAITTPPTLAPSASPTLSVTAPTSNTVPATPPYTTFEVVLDPNADTPTLATSISVTTNNTDTVTIPVVGKVVTPQVTVPEAVMIGSFCVGRAPTTAEARLTSTGTATINLPKHPSLGAMAASGFNLDTGSYPTSLQPNGTATVRVRPLGRNTAGMVTDTLVWFTDAPGTMAMPTTQLTAEFVANGGAISPQFVDFGRVELRTGAEPHVIRIQNCGTVPLALGEVGISPSGEFRDDSAEQLPSSLAPNQTATIIVNFVPTRLGTRTATLTVASAEGDLTVTLTGIGLGPPGGDREQTSFYACDCATSDPAAAWPALVVMLVLRRRRRSGSPAAL